MEGEEKSFREKFRKMFAKHFAPEVCAEVDAQIRSIMIKSADEHEGFLARSHARSRSRLVR